jgi:hypothetical protein
MERTAASFQGREALPPITPRVETLPRPTDYEENVWKISAEIIELISPIFVYRGKKAYAGIHSVYQGKIHGFWAFTFDFLICYA